ncbi:hypothetical protein D3C78_1911590 [compost metagenome]
MHHDRYIQLCELLPHWEQLLVMSLQSVEVGSAYAYTLGPQLGYRSLDFLGGVARIGQIGMAPEVEMVRVGAAER